MVRATSICMSRNPYQRRSVNRRQAFVACARSSSRSTVIGWWSVAMTGQPSRSIILAIPRPRHWLSCTRSKSVCRFRSRRRNRTLNVYGSGKPAPHMMANSWRSIRVLNSHGHGTRNGFSGR